MIELLFNFIQSFVFCSLVNKTELNISLDLCNAICEQLFIFFVDSYVALKIEMKENMEKKVTMRLKNSFSNHWLLVRLNLSSDDTRNCKKQRSLKTVILNLGHKEETLLE